MIITIVFAIHSIFVILWPVRRQSQCWLRLGLLTKSVIILDSSLSHGLEQGRHLEINLEFSLIAVYRFRRGRVLFFIFLHKQRVTGGQRHEVSKPQKRLKNVRGSEDTFEPGSLALPKAQPCSAPNVRSFSPLTKYIRFTIPPRPGLSSKTRLLVFNYFMHSQVTRFAFFRC